MDDLAGLGVDLRGEISGLGERQKFEDAAGDGRVDPKALERGDDAVAAEDGAEPGNSGVGIIPFRIALDHHFHVGLGTLHPIVEYLTRTAYAAGTKIRFICLAYSPNPGAFVALNPAFLNGVAGDGYGK